MELFNKYFCAALQFLLYLISEVKIRNSNLYQWKTFKIRNYRVPLKTSGKILFFPEKKGEKMNNLIDIQHEHSLPLLPYSISFSSLWTENKMHSVSSEGQSWPMTLSAVLCTRESNNLRSIISSEYSGNPRGCRTPLSPSTPRGPLWGEPGSHLSS